MELTKIKLNGTELMKPETFVWVRSLLTGLAGNTPI